MIAREAQSLAQMTAQPKYDQVQDWAKHKKSRCLLALNKSAYMVANLTPLHQASQHSQIKTPRMNGEFLCSLLDFTNYPYKPLVVAAVTVQGSVVEDSSAASVYKYSSAVPSSVSWTVCRLWSACWSVL